MQTRSQFLATGLVPVVSKSKAGDEDCCICFGELTNPVKTPCNHLFDRECIERWLNGQKRNTCPLCKALFFELPKEETTSPAELRRQQIGNALVASRVLSREPPFDNFGSTEYNVSSLQRAAANATYSLGQGRLPAAGDWIELDAPGVLERVVGPTVVEVQSMSPAFIAMANLLPAMAAVTGQPFGASRLRKWHAVCCLLWPQIKALHGRNPDAMILPAVLKEKTLQAARKGADPVDMSFFEGRDAVWFDTLLNYVTLRAWQLRLDKEKSKAAERATKKMRKEAREEPKMKSKCGMM